MKSQYIARRSRRQPYCTWERLGLIRTPHISRITDRPPSTRSEGPPRRAHTASPAGRNRSRNVDSDGTSRQARDCAVQYTVRSDQTWTHERM